MSTSSKNPQKIQLPSPIDSAASRMFEDASRILRRARAARQLPIIAVTSPGQAK